MTDTADESARQLSLLAGEAYASVRLVPEGYRRMAVEWAPLAGFDHVYEHEGNVVLIDTLFADQELDATHAPSGQIVEAGTRPYVELVVANMRKQSPEAAVVIETALRAGKLRYFEVRQPIDDDGKLGDIEARQFAL